MFFGIILCICTAVLFILHTANLVLISKGNTNE